MKFVIIIIALAALKYLQVSPSASRYHWFLAYASKMQLVFGALRSAWLSTIVIILPLVVAIAAIEYVVGLWLWGLVGFLINLVVLWYCLGPELLEEFIESNYAHHKHEHLHEKATVSHQASRLISEKILLRSNENIFAVIFWFCVLGAPGALLYRGVELLRYQAENQTTKLHHVLAAAQLMQAVLDWFPARITAFSYVLAGDFVAGFAEWNRDIWTNWQANKDVLVRTGIAAGGFKLDDVNHADREENRSLERLVGRALVVWLIALAIFTLGRLLY